jgi:hypothetical protein
MGRTVSLAPSIVPSDEDDAPVVHTAVVGQAEILCTLNRDFYDTSVLEYCSAVAFRSEAT